MERTELINLIIEQSQAKRYLEIGVGDGTNLKAIEAKFKVGVDPNVKTPADFHITSDDYFARYLKPFDVIFIDGLHHFGQVYRDIQNTMNICAGVIVVHDCNPQSEKAQQVPRTQTEWNGDVWKAWTSVIMRRPDAFCVDTDQGLGILAAGRLKPLSRLNFRKVMRLTWPDLVKNRTKYLNLKPISEFYPWLLKCM